MENGRLPRDPNFAINQYVYVIGPRSGPRKIGISTRPEVRLLQLRSQYKVRLFLHYQHPRGAFMAAEIEKLTHQLLDDDRIELEWFGVSTERAIEAIRLAEEAYHRGERATARLRDPDDVPRSVSLTLTPRLIGSVEDWRATQDPIPSRSAAVRHLVEAGLAGYGIGPLAVDLPTSAPPEVVR